MAAQPIYVESEEEIPELIDRLRQSSSDHVPLVLPARSRLGQSRFNFQLLRHYASTLGKRVAIISPDPAVQRMAAETGLDTFSQVRDFTPLAQDSGAPLWDAPPAVAPPPVAPPAPRPRPVAAAVPPRPRPVAPVTPAAEVHPARPILYFGALLLLLTGIAAVVLLYPSADVTLAANAQQFSQQADISASPGKAPVRVRVATVEKKASQSANATGVKVTPAASATGTVIWTNKCPAELGLKNGQRVSGAGQTFAQQGDVSVGPNSTVSAPIVAVAAGAAANVPAGVITSYTGDQELGTCLKVSNPSATSGGADEKRDPQVTQSDYDQVRASMEQSLQKDVMGDLTKQSAAGEKLNDKVFYQPADFTTDHKVGDLVRSFSATMSVKGEGTFFMEADVKRSLADMLTQRVPTGYALTDNSIRTDYQVRSAAAGGNIVFTGTGNAFIAPKLNYAQIRSHLAGKSPASAHTYLKGLPVTSVNLKQRPFQLPFLPFVSSRIDIKYVVQPAPAKA